MFERSLSTHCVNVRSSGRSTLRATCFFDVNFSRNEYVRQSVIFSLTPYRTWHPGRRLHTRLSTLRPARARTNGRPAVTSAWTRPEASVTLQWALNFPVAMRRRCRNRYWSIEVQNTAVRNTAVWSVTVYTVSQPTGAVHK